jgi:hypothetical protein
MNGIYLEVMATGHIQRLNADGTPSQQVTGLRLNNIISSLKPFTLKLFGHKPAKNSANVRKSTIQERQAEVC